MHNKTGNLSVVDTAALAPTVSVLMTCYDTARYVGEAVESVLGQTFGDFELIIVNDGSTDGSLEILRSYAKRDNRIRILTGPNVGIVASAIKGMAVARGEFVARLDSDDVALPTRLEKQVAYFREHPECVALGSRVLIVDPDGETLCEWGTLATHEEIDHAHMNAGGPALIHPACMFRRDEAIAVGGYNPAYDVLEDLDLFLRLAERGRIANLTEPLTKWRQHTSSCCHTRHAELCDKHRLVMADACRRRGLNAAARPSEEWNRAPVESDHYIKWTWWALSGRQVRTARKHALAALRRKPLSKEVWRAVACAVRGR